MRAEKEIAILDACVLYPPRLRDLLLSFAEYNLYEPKWTKEILEEREQAARRNHRELSQVQVKSATVAMNNAFPKALIDIDRSLLSSIHLPDGDDIHVLAAALTFRVPTIVTTNLKDFPAKVLSRYSIRAEHPDEFCVRLVRRYPRAAAEAFVGQVSVLKNPPMSTSLALERLMNINMRQTALYLSALLG